MAEDDLDALTPPGKSIRRLHLLAVLVLVLSVSACGGRAPASIKIDDPAGARLGELWIEPRDIAARDLFHGAGGPALAPDRSARFELVTVDDSGFSPGYEVRDRQGIAWNVKLGIEAQPEIVASRVLWALGYHQPPTYLLRSWELTGPNGGPQGIARFRRQSAGDKVVSDWSWYENPFAASRPFKGLLVTNLLLNNWDLKTSNNKVYELTGRRNERRRVYVVRDLGASLGKTTFPRLLAWTPFRAMPQGSRNDVDDFEEQGFIRGVDGQRVKFDYNGTNARLVDALTVDDVVWTCRLLARISDDQWNDAFRAAAYPEPERRRFIRKLKAKIGEGLRLSRS
jgi:hypothetical protein